MSTLALTHARHRARTVTGLQVGSLPVVAAAFSLSAAIAHLGVMAPHFRAWWAHGAFFLACGLTQTLFAALVLWRPRPALALTGIAGNLAILGMYIYSRTNGAPVGPHRGVPEAPGALDLTTAAGQLVLVAVLVAMLDAAARRWAMRMVVLFGLAVWLARGTGVLV